MQSGLCEVASQQARLTSFRQENDSDGNRLWQEKKKRWYTFAQIHVFLEARSMTSSYFFVFSFFPILTLFFEIRLLPKGIYRRLYTF